MGIIARQCAGLVDTPFYRHTGENRRDPHALSWCRLCQFRRNERGVSAWGLARCHDTDDTNRGFGDTRTIRWMVKIARSETFQMSIDWSPERRPAVRMAVRDCADRASSVANEDYGSCPRSRLETDYEPPAMGSPQPSFTRPNLAQSKYVAAPASRDCC